MLGGVANFPGVFHRWDDYSSLSAEEKAEYYRVAKSILSDEGFKFARIYPEIYMGGKVLRYIVEAPKGDYFVHQVEPEADTPIIWPMKREEVRAVCTRFIEKHEAEYGNGVTS